MPPARYVGNFRGSLKARFEMEITTDEPGHSLNSVQLPLKKQSGSAPKTGGSVHTLLVGVADAPPKSDYELARDRHVAALQEFLRPVQTATTAL